MLISRILLASLLGLLIAAGASAERAISGGWHDHRGAAIDIPLRGGLVTCTPNEIGSPFCPVAGFVGASLPNKAYSGGVPARVPISAASLIPDAANAVGATLTVPPGIFTQPTLMSERQPVPTSGAVHSLITSFGFRGPLLESEITDFTRIPNTPMGVPGVPPGATANILKPRTASFLDMPNRAAVANNAGSGTTTTGIALNSANLTYKHGANRFGGPMQATLSGTGGLVLIGGKLPAPLAGFQPLQPTPIPPGGTLGTVQLGATWGRGFNGGQPSGTLFLYYHITNLCPGVKTFERNCSTVDVLANPLPTPLPKATSTNWGHPWTTGTVIVSKTGTGGAGTPVTEILSAMGGDTITPNGARQLQLVSGAFGIRDSVTGVTALNQLSAFVITLPEPGVSVAFAASLGLIAVLYAVRRRL